MAAPVINTTVSVLGYRQFQSWEFQPAATNDPTFWICTALPSGVGFDPDFGRISGPATVPGVCVFAMRAGNDDGVSEPVTFAMGIEATGFSPPGFSADMVIDVATRRIGVMAGGSINWSDDASPSPAGFVRPSPILFGKYGDDLVLAVRILKGGVNVDLTVSSMKLVLKEYDPEVVLVTSDTFLAEGTGDAKIQRIHAKLEGSKLQSALDNYEDDDATEFPALAEIEVTVDNTGGFGPDSLVFSSRTFTIMIPRDLAPNA